MMRRLDRRMKKFMEMRNKEKEKFWSFLEDIIKKGQTLIPAGNLLIDVYAFVAATVASSIILIEKLGDHVQYFVCPYSGMYARIRFSASSCCYSMRVKPIRAKVLVAVQHTSGILQFTFSYIPCPSCLYFLFMHYTFPTIL
jgi:hypothetical protein